MTDPDGTPVRLVGAVQDISEHRKVVADLSASEARFRELFDAMPLYVALWRRAGDDFVLEDVNPANMHLSGGQIRAYLGCRLSDFYTDMPDMVDRIHQCLRNDTVLGWESRYRMRTTSVERHLSFKLAPVPPDLVMAIAEDIDERVRDQIELQATTNLLLEAERLAGAGSWEWDVAADRWTFSDNWCRLHGVEVPPATTADLLPIAHPDDIPHIKAAFDDALDGTDYAIMHRVIHQRTGQVRFVKVHGSPVMDDAGRVAKVRGVALDVTEREHDERAIADNLMRLTMAQRIARIGSATIDPTKDLSDWSEEMYRIFERDPALGPPRLGDHASLYKPEDYTEFRRAVDTGVNDGTPFDMTVPLHMPDGRIKWIHILGHPMPEQGPAGRVLHATVQDITDRKRAEEFREDIERIIRHDLRSPVAATVAGINILRLGDTLTADQLHTLDMMEQANKRQLSMLDASMTLHRMEAGTYTLTAEPVALGAVVAEVTAELRVLAETRRGTVRIRGDTSLVAMGDAWLCQTLLSNLVRNALEALPGPNRTVDITLTRETDHAVLRVTNPGSVPEDVRPRFFEKYATSGKPGGTGLGTYSARMMAHAQGGSVDLDTSTAGQTTLIVRLPLDSQATGQRTADGGRAPTVP